MIRISTRYSLKAHEARFATEKQCLEYLAKVRWNNIPTCPECGNQHKNYKLKNERDYVCSNKDCQRQFSLTKGTIFQNSKLPLTTWFQAIYLFNSLKKSLSSYSFSDLLGMRQKTAWLLLHKLRAVMDKENQIILNGIVQVDETYFGPNPDLDRRLQVRKRKHDKEQTAIHGPSRPAKLKEEEKQKRGRKKGSTAEVLAQKRIEFGDDYYRDRKLSKKIPYIKGIAILGMIESAGKIVLKKIGTGKKGVRRETVLPLLKKHISSDSILVTDQSNLYFEVTDFARHIPIKHGKKFVNPEGWHTNEVENAWRNLQSLIRSTYHHVAYHHYDAYLDEFAYRWNRRNQNKQILFDDFIPLACEKTFALKDIAKRRPLPNKSK